VIFKNNSEYIIPFIIRNCNIFKNENTVSYIDIGVLYNYLYIDILLNNKTCLNDIYNIIKKEPNLNSIKLFKNKIQLKFLVDKNMDFIVLPIINNGYDAITKDDLKHCAIFWKEKFSEILSISK